VRADALPPIASAHRPRIGPQVEFVPMALTRARRAWDNPRAMLKKIPCSELTPGMYIQSFEGSWFSHPFWRTKFVLQDPADFEAIRRSGIGHCWIDVSKGLDAAARPAQPSARPANVAAGTPASAAAAAAAKPAAQAVEFEAEVEQAAALVRRFKGAITEIFGEARMGKALEIDRVMPFVEEVSASVQRNSGALVSLARLKTKDDYTYMHSVSVCALMVSLARQLGLSEEETRQAGIGGMLHDIGKMAVPDSILNKPGSLTDSEFAVIRTHPERGFDMLKGCSGLSEVPLDVCLHHHEKMDGSGYPKGLKAEQISRMARMGAICDVYDAITSNRAYKPGWDPSASIQRMSQWKGHFDAELFQAFVRSVGIYPVGTLVRMQSDRLGVVIDQNPRSLVKPRVKIFYSARKNMPIRLHVIDLAEPSCTDRIVSRENPEQWGFQHIQELWTGSAVTA
jgi:putative nucleotidyltransferase with HDIG domain